MSERRPRCNHCVYWVPDPNGNPPTVGHCHRFPPHVFANIATGTIVQRFPMTETGHWCGEWSCDEEAIVAMARRQTEVMARKGHVGHAGGDSKP